MAFVKGDPNINRLGRPKKGQSFAEVLREQAESMAGSTDMSMMQAIAKILWKKASEGDLKAIDMLMDRIDGKPRQGIDASIKIEQKPDLEKLSESDLRKLIELQCKSGII